MGGVKLYGQIPIEYSLGGGITHTSALCFRRSIVEKYIDLLGLGFDMVLQVVLSQNTMFALFDEFFSVYRYRVGIFADKDNYLKRCYYYDNFYLPANRLLKQLYDDKLFINMAYVESQINYNKMLYMIRHWNYEKAKFFKEQITHKIYKKKLMKLLFIDRFSMICLSIALMIIRKGKSI